MKIAVWAGHVGSEGIHPSGQHGGGEAHTFGFLAILNRYYDVTAVLQNGVYPAFDYAYEYGMDLSDVEWKPAGDNIDWLRAYDVLVSMNHAQLCPPLCRRNILVSFFPQYPQWDVSGYDTIVANSAFTAEWIRRYWGREAEVVYPPIVVGDIVNRIREVPKRKQIACIGRFFDVPGGNNKKHLTILQAFKDLMRSDWELVFVGAIQNQRYYQEVREAAKDDERIKFKHNLSRQEYLEVLARSAFVWSATGYETTQPSAKEHFGMFTTEAMACATIPMVHNSGGAPESECLTWNTSRELIEKTNGLIDDFNNLESMLNELIQHTHRFDIHQIAKDLVDVVERPKIVSSSGSKIFLPEIKSTDLKVGLISDSPTKTFGFSVVTKAIATGLIERGFRVACYGLQDPHLGQSRFTPPDIERIVRDEIKHYDGNDDDFMTAVMKQIRKIEPCPIWRGCQHDASGFQNLRQFIEVEKPDILYLNYDPGNIRMMIDALRDTRTNLPLIVYLPIEGAPVTNQYIETLRLIRMFNGRTICYTKWGAQAVKEAGGPQCEWLHHGCDHANFRPLPEEEKKKLRFAVGWQSKTVLISVGRNKRTKGFGTIMVVAQMLKAEGLDFVWYLHTNPYDRMPNSSMPLAEMVHTYGVEDVIIFPPDLDDQGQGVPYDEPINIGAVTDTNDIQQLRRYNLATLSMIERYNLADVYVNLSELEGFGLPPLEAMGCGLPVISVEDQGVQQEVLGEAPIYIPVARWDPTWHTSSRLAQVDPGQVARAILDVTANSELMADLKDASLKRHSQFKWDDTVDKLAKAIMEQVI